MQQHPDKASPLVVPDVTDEMRAFIPDAFASDLDNPVARLVIQRLIDAGREPLRNRVQPEGAITASTRTKYERIIALWLAFVRMSDDEMVALSHDERCDLADAWLADCAARLSANTVNERRSALRWWALARGVQNPITDVGRKVKAQAPGRGSNLPLSEEEMNVLLGGLHGGTVLPAAPHLVSEELRERRRGWHLRWHAAVAIAVTCSLRPESELGGLTDDTVIGIADDGTMTLRIDNKKVGRKRDIALRPRQDLLCPLTALGKWLDWCATHTDGRPDGRLLPPVSLKGPSPWSHAASYERTAWNRHIVPFLKDTLGYDITGKTLHGFRGVAPTAAVEAGWDHTRLRDLGDWRKLSTAVGYVNGTGAPTIDLYGGDQ